MIDEKYIKALEDLVEHLKGHEKEAIDIANLSNEIQRIAKDITEIKGILKKVEKPKKAEAEKPEKQKRKRAERWNYKKFIDDNLVGRTMFKLNDIKTEFNLPTYKVYNIADKLKSNYADRFRYSKDSKGLMIFTKIESKPERRKETTS